MPQYPPTDTTTSLPPVVAPPPETEREPAAPSTREPDTLESISLTELEQVRALRASGQIPEYYDAIAMIIKRYITEKYHIKTLEATTGEILQALPHELTDTVVDHVGEILRMCDMIHFSRHRPSRSELEGIYRSAKEFLESQIVVPAPETDEEDEEDDMSELYEHYRRMM
jgi:hypothetical protein